MEWATKKEKKTMKRTDVISYCFLTAFLVLLFLAGSINFSSCGKDSEAEPETSGNTESLYPAKITAVVDGDTVKIQFAENIPDQCSKNETVRLIGVNTPELNLHKDAEAEHFALEAYQYTNRYYKEEVNLQLDDISAMRDKYGRLLAYVWLCNATMLNKNLIEDGYGRYYNAFLFNEKYMKEFSEAEILAIQSKKGIWGGIQNDKRR